MVVVVVVVTFQHAPHVKLESGKAGHIFGPNQVLVTKDKERKEGRKGRVEGCQGGKEGRKKGRKKGRNKNVW